MATVTAVRPTARFGELNLNDDMLIVLKKNHNFKVGLMVVFLFLIENFLI